MMKPLFPVILTVIFLNLLLAGCRDNKKNRSEEALLGEWYAIKGDMQAYSLQKDGRSYIFTGTRDMHPVVYGTWRITRNKFALTIDKGLTTEYSFDLKNDTLILNNGEEIYTRTIPLEVKFPEVMILKSLSEDIQSLSFSAPAFNTLDWGYVNDSTKTAQKFSLRGYSVTALTSIVSGNLKKISDYLKDNGFEPDTLFISEKCVGYWNNNHIVTLCVSPLRLASTDSIKIVVTSALIIK